MLVITIFKLLAEADPPTGRHIWEIEKYCIKGDTNKKDAMRVTFYLKSVRSPEESTELLM